tara:strand:- start:2321 stop:3061 length:741 start_codon:yes stop_codon:yes gene_type:complete
MDKKIKSSSNKKNILKTFYKRLYTRIPILAEFLKYFYVKIFGILKILIFSFKIIILKLKNPHLLSLPSKHIYALDILLKISLELKKKKIPFFLLGGTLLGSIRQEAFAGRPSDVDIGMKYEDQKKFFKILSKINYIISPVETRKIPGNKIYKLQLISKYIFIDINFFINKKPKKYKNNIWLNPYEVDKKKKQIKFFKYNIDNLQTTKLYGYEFNSPLNPQIYLKKKFGKNWKVPDKKQFLWKKINF